MQLRFRISVKFWSKCDEIRLINLINGVIPAHKGCKTAHGWGCKPAHIGEKEIPDLSVTRPIMTLEIDW